MPAGTLFVVATPIGNMGDISARAVETLRTCARIVAEDTRRTRALLTHFGIGGKPIDALHAHSSRHDLERIVERIENGEQVAVVTDAGTPIVSDPGGMLVQEAVKRGFRVVPIPGASAVLAALVGAGLNGDGRFRFFGFLPRDGREREEALGVVAETPEQVVLFESPQRTQKTLVDLARATPARGVAVARELTKLHEEFVRGTLDELAEATEREWIGEIVIVLASHDPASRTLNVDDPALDARIDQELAAGVHAKSLSERLAAWSGRPKRDVYERIIARKKK